jgi:hypothetical protein
MRRFMRQTGLILLETVSEKYQSRLEDVKKSISLKFRLNRNVCRRPNDRL